MEIYLFISVQSHEPYKEVSRFWPARYKIKLALISKYSFATFSQSPFPITSCPYNYYNPKYHLRSCTMGWKTSQLRIQIKCVQNSFCPALLLFRDTATTWNEGKHGVIGTTSRRACHHCQHFRPSSLCLSVCLYRSLQRWWVWRGLASGFFWVIGRRRA